MGRKDRGHKETKRPKKDKAKKGAKEPLDRVPLREPERVAKATPAPPPPE